MTAVRIIGRDVWCPRALIDPMNEPQVQHWAREMQVQMCDLRMAVRLVGLRLSDLRRFFGKSAPIINLENRLAKKQVEQSSVDPFPRI